jgi:hypothetical protein
MRRTVRTIGAGHVSDGSAPFVACPLCHHAAVRVRSASDSAGTIIVQCTGCLQESTLQSLTPDADDDAGDEEE